MFLYEKDIEIYNYVPNGYNIKIDVKTCHIHMATSFDSLFEPLSSPFLSTAAEQVVTCARVTQRARGRYPVGTSFLDEVFSGFSSPGSFRPPESPNIIWP